MENKKHILAITAIIKDLKGERFLIIKRSDKEIAYPGKWSFPGGKLEKGETVLQTLRREVLEEVGLEIEDHKKYLKDYTFVRPDGHNVIGFVFLVKAKSERINLSKDFDDYRWVYPKELNSYDHITGMEEEVHLAYKE